MSIILDGQTIAAYGAYAGNAMFTVDQIKLAWTDADFEIDIFGLVGDPVCNGTVNRSIPNSCGIHVHENADCDDAGGHYWMNSSISDPWENVSYASNETYGWVIPGYGYNMSMTEGKALVFHDANGTRAGCVLINERDPFTALFEANETMFVDYTGYAGDATLTSIDIGISLTGSVFAMEFTISTGGTEDMCKGFAEDCVGANCCGIHIHENADCSDAGGHFYEGDSDPWVDVTYTRDTTDPITYYVDLGTTVSAFNHSMVIHDGNGGRMSCILIIDDTSTTTDTNTTTTTTYTDAGYATVASFAAMATLLLA
jgi:hypothetical protein